VFHLIHRAAEYHDTREDFMKFTARFKRGLTVRRAIYDRIQTK